MTQQTAITNMIKQQLRTNGILDEAILNLYRLIPREAFVPPALQAFAYSDAQLALPHEQRMMTPLEEARLLQALKLQGHETVLEIGTGSGFLTALLSTLCKQVISIDYYAKLTHLAQQNLALMPCYNAKLLTGNGLSGVPEYGPYDVIILTGSLPLLSDIPKASLKPGGKVVAILGETAPMQAHLYGGSAEPDQLLFETTLPLLIPTIKRDTFVF